MFRLIPRPACPACLQSEGQQTICEISYARLKAHMESAYVRDSIETHLPDILPHDYVIVECSRCFLLYQKYVPDSDSMKILYSEMISPDATFDRHKFHMDDLAYYERHFRDIFSVIAHLKRHPSQIRVLDFGSGWAQWARVAKAIGAECCHLGQEDFFDAGYTHVSQLVSPPGSLQIGLSTHSASQAERALAAQPDYIAVGPVFATGTKPTAQPVTLDYVRWAAAHVTIPWFAIGGVNLETLDAILSAGARRVCVVSAILNGKDVAAACRAFRRQLD